MYHETPTRPLHNPPLPSRFSFAIVGINITDLAYCMLVSGALKTHLYNVAPEMPSLLHFQQTFCEYEPQGRKHAGNKAVSNSLH